MIKDGNRSKNVKKQIVCKLCGVEFERESNAQKYCPVCAGKRRVYSVNENKKSIGNINEEARAAGMSYGQYVASMQQREEAAT